jgi:hypothetical protein
MPSPSESGRKIEIARFVSSGSVNSATIELIAVRVTLSATSPRNRCEYRFAVVPPGEAASRIMPTARIGGNWKSTTSPKHSAGNSTSWQASATITAFGCFPTLAKSAGVSERPSPNMMMPRATGSPIVVNADMGTSWQRARPTASA